MRDLVEAEPSFQDLLEAGERILWRSRPGGRALFLSVLPRMLRDLFFLALIIAAVILAPPGQANQRNLFILLLLILYLLYSLYREVREATATAVSHYLISDRRLIWILPRAESRRLWSIWKPGRRNEDPEMARILSVKHGPIQDGRATIRIRTKGFVEGWKTPVRIWEKSKVRLHGVTEPEKAVALLRQFI